MHSGAEHARALHDDEAGFFRGAAWRVPPGARAEGRRRSLPRPTPPVAAATRAGVRRRQERGRTTCIVKMRGKWCGHRAGRRLEVSGDPLVPHQRGRVRCVAGGERLAQPHLEKSSDAAFGGRWLGSERAAPPRRRSVQFSSVLVYCASYYTVTANSLYRASQKSPGFLRVFRRRVHYFPHGGRRPPTARATPSP